MSVGAQWDELVEDMTEHPDVTVGKMFGCRGLRLGRKFFAILWEDRLVLKLERARGAEVVDEGGSPFEPMPDRVMGGWFVAGADADWLQLAVEAKDYLASVMD